MADDVIKSFLISLGFQVKKTEQKNMVDAVALVGKTAAGVVASLAALATAAAAATVAVANTFDKLYFVSQRTNTSVQNIRALSYAFSQVGGSSEEAVGALESFQRAMRTNPGTKAFLESIGVVTEVNGKARDSMEMLLDGVDKVQAMTKGQQFAGAQLAKIFGLDEQTYDMMLRFRKEVRENQATYNKWSKTFGIDAKASAEASNQLMHGLRELSTVASLAGQRLLLELLPGLNSIKQAIVDWLNAHPELIEKIFRSIGEAAGWIGEKIKQAYAALEPFFSYLSDKATEMWQDGSFLRAWEKVATAFERVVTAIRGVLRWLNELDRATDMSSGLNAIKRFLGWVDQKTSGQVQEGFGALGRLDRATDTGVGVPSGGGSGGGPGLLRRGLDGIRRRGARAAEADKTNYNFTGDNANALKQAAKELGTSPEDLATVISYETSGTFSPKKWGGKGGRYMGLIQFGPAERAQFGANENQSFKEQLPAVVRFLKTRGFKPGMSLNQLYATINGGNPYVSQNANDGNGTIAQHVERMRSSHGRRANRFLNSGSAPAAAPPTSPPPLNMTPGAFDVNRLSAAPGGTQSNNVDASKTIKQNNPVSVQVNGASDPAATGQAVESAVNRANERSLRNAQTAIR